MQKQQIIDMLNDVYTSTEAAEYLNISTQRLNQLVHDGQLLPVKANKSVLLFYKGDLDERKYLNYANNQKSKKVVYNNTKKYFDEAVFYYTIQQFFKNSDKATVKFLNSIIKKEHDKYTKELCFDVVNDYLNITSNEFLNVYKHVLKSFQQLDNDVVISKKGDELYSKLLEKTDDAPPFLFMKGNFDLLKEKGVCVVGSRNASQSSKNKTDALVKSLIKRNITIIAGLAKGIDTQAHQSALSNNGKTIAVIGSPINQYYPKENKEIQKTIENEGLVISQFPPCNKIERWNFPIRNATMSGISLATIIMEAGETSGALIQADYALKQNRFVLIPKSAYDNDLLKWPKKYVERGAKTFETLKDIFNELNNSRIIEEDNVTNERIIENVQMD